MKPGQASFRQGLRCAAALACLALSCAQGVAHETGEAQDHPGFRPGSPLATEFVAALKNATIAVHPTILRRSERTAHSFDSRSDALALLRSEGIDAVPGNVRIDLGRLYGSSQWGLFEADLGQVAEAAKGRHRNAQYHLVLEFLLPVSDDAIFGIECYVVDQHGKNTFSFLLNSHHRLFADANLVADDSSEAARRAMFARATEAAIVAFQAQLDLQRGRAARAAARQAALEAGDYEEVIFDDFETVVPAAADENGVPLGFNKFADERSNIVMGISAEHPPVPGEVPGNNVLQLDMDVRNWAGFVHMFYYTDDDSVFWSPYDWRGFDGIAFWLYGQDRGGELFVDIIDNRNIGSRTDDAERFVYTFKDDSAGWRRIVIPFEDFVRKEVYNGAPNDGLGLMTAHGWAIGATGTNGPVTYFVDDFALQHVGLASHKQQGGQAQADYPINELPMYGLGDKTPEQLRADDDYIRYMTRGGRSRQAAAEAAARNAWEIFYLGDKAQAIRRFNQAWLLDEDNQLALWGFAVTCMDRGRFDEAVGFYRMAIEKGPSNAGLDRDYRLAMRQLEKTRTTAPTLADGRLEEKTAGKPGEH